MVRMWRVITLAGFVFTREDKTMDPNANLREQSELLIEMSEYEADGSTWHPAYLNARDDLQYHRSVLSEWLECGGFAPDWSKYPDASKYWGH